MSKILTYIGSAAVIVLAIGLSGCSEEHPPVTTDSNKITPGMEKMKEEMIKAFQTKSLGKSQTAAPKK